MAKVKEMRVYGGKGGSAVDLTSNTKKKKKRMEGKELIRMLRDGGRLIGVTFSSLI